ncbi:MAG: hypothetical protein ABIQ60_15590 [Burkholderiaceae bacterium]
MRGNPVMIPVELALPPPVGKPPKTPEEMLHAAVRLSFVMACFALLDTNLVPLTVMTGFRGSIIKSLAIMIGYPDLLRYMFWGSITLSVPFLITQFSPFVRPEGGWRRRWHGCTIRWQQQFRKLAMVGYLLAGLAWLVMAWYGSRGLDIGNYPIALWTHAAANLAFARVLAMSINHELIRQIFWRDAQ